MSMKKIVLFTVAFFICSLGFSIEAKVISVSGKAQVQKSGVWKNISVGDVLSKGNLIQTGFKSQVVFSIKSNNENSKITVNQLSRITIEQLMEDNSGDTTSVFVTTGSVKSEIKKTTDFRTNYTVRSPVATASVRGTELTLSNGFRCSSVATHQGNVAVSKTKKSNRAPLVQGDSRKEVSKEVTYACKAGQTVIITSSKVTKPHVVSVNKVTKFDSSCDTKTSLESVSSDSNVISSDVVSPLIKELTSVNIIVK